MRRIAAASILLAALTWMALSLAAESLLPPAAVDASTLSNSEAVALLMLVLMFPLSVLAVRWLTQREIQRMMHLDSLENDESGPAVSDDQGVAMTVLPRFEMHDKTRELVGAVQARERFVSHSLSLFRRYVMLDVVAGVLYVALLYLLGMLSADESSDSIALGMAIIGSVYPLLAGLRYLLYRRQFRPLDARFETGSIAFLFSLLRRLLSPKFQAASDRYPLMSWRTAAFMMALALVGLVAIGVFTNHPQWEPWAFTATMPVLLVLLAVYALISRQLLRREFIRSRAQLVLVLDRLEQRPRHLDLSFRRLEAMCHNNTWKIAVQEFARRSEVLLMDLRGFSSARKGCEYEVDFLLDAVPLGRVLFLVESGGDHDAVRKLILERWKFLSPTSPNLENLEPVARIYVSKESDEADVQGILDLLIHAA